MQQRLTCPASASTARHGTARLHVAPVLRAQTLPRAVCCSPPPKKLKPHRTQGEPELERLKRELEELKHAPRGLEGTFRTAAEMERHRCACQLIVCVGVCGKSHSLTLRGMASTCPACCAVLWVAPSLAKGRGLQGEPSGWSVGLLAAAGCPQTHCHSPSPKTHMLTHTPCLSHMCPPPQAPAG